jgi:arylsulfatase A-like enzyme
MASPHSDTPQSGAEQLDTSLRLAALAWIVLAIQNLLLVLRPTPYGGPYINQPLVCLGLSAFYDLLAVAGLSLPAFLVWLVRHRRPVSPRMAQWVHLAQLVLLVLGTGLDQADHELMRFLGTHLEFGLVRTYERVGAWGSDMLHVFLTDRGGPGLPFVLLLLGMAAVGWAGSRVIRRPRRTWPLGLGAAAVLVPLAVPFVAYNLPGSHFRRNRVRPAVVTLALELARDSRAAPAPADLARLIADHRDRWLATEGDSTWRFTDPRYPLLRAASDTAASATRWNVIYLQLETFRGWDTGFLRPDLSPSPTPFLDSLSATADAAFWTRHLSFGPPTINGFIAGHCSIRPHGSRNITTVFTAVALDCLPAVLRRHGWYTAYFTASNPDWDNQTLWLDRWYDESRFYAAAQERDREEFRLAAERIHQIGASGRPFFATVVSISNHYPFRSREPALDLNDGRTPAEAIRNTMHYTDDVVREFVGRLSREPWWSHTLLVLVGDHGYNLGEHDGTPGQRGGWRESIWVPLLIAGPHPRLPRGPHHEVASLLDVAPTVADLLGIHDPTAWLGRSLLRPPAGEAMVTLARGEAVFAETSRWSLVKDPLTGQPHLYDPAADPLQRNDLAGRYPAEAARLLGLIEDEQTLGDYLVERNRIWPAGERP